MAKVIERNVPIAEENVTLSGQPATNMFEDWSEEMTDKAENPYAVYMVLVLLLYGLECLPTGLYAV